ncbi:MAG: hypothetical protein EOM64_02380 [Erysipelotrichia bacterium]|nr:hypothetical protein [Erysipelotrichia bacterium]
MIKERSAESLPDNKILQMLLSAVRCVSISTIVMIGIVGALLLSHLDVISGALIRAADTAFDSALVFYLGTVFYSVRLTKTAPNA